MSNIVMKKCCGGCPFDYGQPATEMAYNLGCLPSVGEVHEKCLANDTAWACHSAPTCVCAGYAEMYPERVNLPLQIEDGVHVLIAHDVIGVPPIQAPSPEFILKLREKYPNSG